MKNFNENKIADLSKITGGGDGVIDICFTIDLKGFFNGNLKKQIDEFD